MFLLLFSFYLIIFLKLGKNETKPSIVNRKCGGLLWMNLQIQMVLWQIPENCEKIYPTSTFFVISGQGDHQKIFQQNFLLDNNLSHLLRKKFSKSICHRRRIISQRLQILHFLNCLCSFSFKFFNTVLSILKSTNFELSENA